METDYRNLPRTLLLTAELDPLRDEGERYARRLEEAWKRSTAVPHCGAFHGFFAAWTLVLACAGEFYVLQPVSGAVENESGRFSE